MRRAIKSYVFGQEKREVTEGARMSSLMSFAAFFHLKYYNFTDSAAGEWVSVLSLGKRGAAARRFHPQ